MRGHLSIENASKPGHQDPLLVGSKLTVQSLIIKKIASDDMMIPRC